jgi:hypothetical protein
VDLIQIKSGEIDTILNETEFHVNSWQSGFTTCGLAIGYGESDRVAVAEKQGNLKDVICRQCRKIIIFYKNLK